jgi:hypothetical protein
MAAAARSFGIGTVVHMLILSVANRASQYVGGGAGKWLYIGICSVADVVPADVLCNSLSQPQRKQIGYSAHNITGCTALSVNPNSTYIDATPISLNNDRISSPRSVAIVAKSDVCAL